MKKALLLILYCFLGKFSGLSQLPDDQILSLSTPNNLRYHLFTDQHQGFNSANIGYDLSHNQAISYKSINFPLNIKQSDSVKVKWYKTEAFNIALAPTL